MVRTGLSALALFGFVAGMDCRAESVFINLKPEAEVDRGEVRLADIAEIAARDANIAAQLGGNVVFKCPGLAQPCRVGKTDIMAATQAKAQQAGANVIWGSNEAVSVRGRMRALSLAPAIDRAAVRILQQMDQGYPLALSVKEGPASIEAPPGAAEFRPEFDQMRWVAGGLELPINVLVDGVSVARPLIRYSLRRSLVSTTAERADDGRGSAPRVAGGASIGQSVDPVPESGSAVVAKNKKVRLLIDSGPVRVEAEGIALADADFGGTVRVRRPNGLADVHGRAVDRGTVLVEEN